MEHTHTAKPAMQLCEDTHIDAAHEAEIIRCIPDEEMAVDIALMISLQLHSIPVCLTTV